MTTIVSYTKTENNVKKLITLADSKISAGSLGLSMACIKAKVLNNFIVSGCGDLLTVGIAFDFCKMHPVVPTDLREFYAYMEQLREFIFTVHSAGRNDTTIVLNTPLGLAEINASKSALTDLNYIAAGSGKMKLMTLMEANRESTIEECFREAVDLDSGSGGEITVCTLDLTEATVFKLPSNTNAMLNKSKTLKMF